jgi:hypothetical protein
MKAIWISLLLSVPFILSGQVNVRKASSTEINSVESLKQNLIAGKTRIDEVIAPWQKEKLATVSDKLRKTKLTGPSGNNPVDMVTKEVKNSFYRLTDPQVDFFATYVIGSLCSTDSQVPVWMQNTLQKQQQLIQMLSNVSKMLNDEGIATIRKIGCSGSECDD